MWVRDIIYRVSFTYMTHTSTMCTQSPHAQTYLADVIQEAMDTFHDLVYRTHQLDTALIRVWHRFTEDLDRCLGTLREGEGGGGGEAQR